jgi:hypothetical protein
MAKPRPERVIPSLARLAIERARGDMKKVYSEYIRAHFQATGSLAPGCDARDLVAWIEKNAE